MKIKIFKGTNIKKLEAEINDFIRDNDVIDIKQSAGEYETILGQPTRHVIITVLYK